MAQEEYLMDDFEVILHKFISFAEGVQHCDGNSSVTIYGNWSLHLIKAKKMENKYRLTYLDRQK